MIPILMALLGGAAEGIYKTGKDAQDEERTMRLRQMESDLEMKRQEAIQAMRDKAEQAKEERISARNKSDAGLINSMAADAPTRVAKAKEIIEADTGIKHTNEEVKSIIADPSWTQNYGAVHQTQTGADTEWQGGGLINQRTNLVPSKDRTAYQEQMDLGNAAGSIGRTDLQDRYTRAAQSERQLANDENRYASSERRADQQDKKQEQMFEWQKTQAGINNRRLDLAESRNARQQDYMELRDSRLDDDSKRKAALGALSDLEKKSSLVSSEIKTGMLSPEALELSKKEIKSLNDESARYRNLLGNMSGLNEPGGKQPIQMRLPSGAIVTLGHGTEEEGRAMVLKAQENLKNAKPPAEAKAGVAADKPQRGYYESNPSRLLPENKPASQADVAAAQSAVNSAKAKLDSIPQGDSKNLSGGSSSALRIQASNELNQAKAKLEELMARGR